MTSFVIERSPVTQALKTTLLAGLVDAGPSARDYLVDVGEAPAGILKDANGKLVDPYAIIWPLPSQTIYAPGMFRGTLAHPDSGATLTYQITSVGRTDMSAQIMADKIRHILLDRSANGAFVNPISPGAGAPTVIHRTNREIGLAQPSEGLWQVVDLYELEVQANA